MTLANILKEKKDKKNNLLADFKLKNTKLPIGLIKLNSNIVDQVLIDALKILPGNFVIFGSNKNFSDNSNISYTVKETISSGFDFIVCDEDEDSILKYLKSGVVPIIGKSHHMSSILKEFNAAKVEGNAFIFENTALCDIYYAIIRYTENYKFSYDNKALVKNVLSV